MLNADFPISFQVSQNFVPKGLIGNKSPLLQVIMMAWCKRGAKPLCEPMMTKVSDAIWYHDSNHNCGCGFSLYLDLEIGHHLNQGPQFWNLVKYIVSKPKIFQNRTHFPKHVGSNQDPISEFPTANNESVLVNIPGSSTTRQTTVWCCYNAVRFLKNPHNKHP